jgi:hypothetical protein
LQLPGVGRSARRFTVHGSSVCALVHGMEVTPEVDQPEAPAAQSINRDGDSKMSAAFSDTDEILFVSLPSLACPLL